MTKFQEQLQTIGQEAKLSVDDKALMRERLVSYMEHKPIRREAVTAASVSQRSWGFGFFRTHHLTGALLIALVATSSTFGVSSAADGALPGDLLYPVKINVNEGIKTALLDTQEERISWERERAELRLKEASQLAAEGRLDSKNQEKVATLFAQHTEAVVKEVQEVEKDDPVLAAEVSTEFEAALDTHEAVLARLIVEQEEDADAVDEGARDLVEQVRTAAREAGKMADEAEEEVLAAIAEEPAEEPVEETANQGGIDSPNMQVRAAYRAQERAHERLAEVEVLLAELEGHDELVAQARAQLDSAREHLDTGAAALEVYEHGSAYADFRRANASFQKVQQLAEVADLFDVELAVDDSVTDEVQIDTVDADGVAVAAEVAESVEEKDMRGEAAQRIGEARVLLLTQEGYEAEVASEANNLIKDAIAHIMRGDIAIALDDAEGAQELFVAANTYAQRAIEVLERAVADGDVTDVMYDTDVEELVTDTATPTDSVAPLVFTQRYSGGRQIYEGSLAVPSACTALTHEALVAESYPEQVTIAFTTVEGEGEDCPNEPKQHDFLVYARASRDAELTGVTLNGEPIDWEFAPTE